MNLLTTFVEVCLSIMVNRLLKLIRLEDFSPTLIFLNSFCASRQEYTARICEIIYNDKHNCSNDEIIGAA